jgi:hypothetical protein
MKNLSRLIVMFACAGMLGGMAAVSSDYVYASDRHAYKQHSKGHAHGAYKGHGRYKAPHVIHHGPRVVVPDRRVRRYHNIYIHRPHGHLYPGYGNFYADSDAFAWLAFTAITLKVLDNLNEDQQRAHEAAQVKATTVPVGETIVWNQGNASGSVTPTRDGTSTSGRYCREFQHEVTVAGRKEQAYGVACRQPDGSWEIVTTGTQ